MLQNLPKKLDDKIWMYLFVTLLVFAFTTYLYKDSNMMSITLTIKCGQKKKKWGGVLLRSHGLIEKPAQLEN